LSDAALEQDGILKTLLIAYSWFSPTIISVFLSDDDVIHIRIPGNKEAGDG
jgi:hypothetical protein